MSAVRPDPSQHRALADVLIAAFQDDPVMSWAFPNPGRRAKYGRRFFAHTIRRLADDNLTWTTPEVSGVSVWAAPGNWSLGALDLIRLARATGGGQVPQGPRTLLGLAGIEARHPGEPHLYLPCVGVAPGHQGQGIGSALIRPGLAHADALGLPAFLESSNERNVPLYERHGFRVTKVIRLPGGPRVWLMWRPAVATVPDAG
ncbi:MAG: hypothetical protein QOF76_1731 [Solirubrobacteraceae bacterium]|nr:hypothetical protein [Solirubrobacteraceae bacterium]